MVRPGCGQLLARRRTLHGDRVDRAAKVVVLNDADATDREGH